MVDLRYLSDFLDLARTGSFSATARNCSVSQPALTRRIQQLEKWSGRLLFDRSATPLKLTAAGNEFRPIAARLIDELQAFRKRGARPASAKPVRCMSLHSLGSAYLADWLNRTVRGRLRHPLEISLGTYDQCFAALRENEVDVALVYQSGKVRDARFKALGRTHIGREVFGPIVSSTCATKPPIIELSRDNYLGKALSPAFDRCKRRLGYAAGPIASRFDAVRALVDAGSGVGWLPESTVRPELVAGTLRVIDDATLKVELDIILIAASEENLALSKLLGPAEKHSPSPRS
jgi:DNA-binding transcriptional LysR family regulator